MRPWLALFLTLSAPALAAEPPAGSGWDLLDEELGQMEPPVPAAAEPSTSTATVVADAAVLQLGAAVYRAQCATCHGIDGDGNGPSARFLRGSSPTNFQRGLYKWRSTLTSSPPTDADIARSIREGLPGSAMPSWKGVLSEESTDAVAQYVKVFSNRWEREEVAAPITVPPVPDNLRTRAPHGREAFVLCAGCHGSRGTGDGPATPTFVDNRGNPIRPADFTRAVFKGGSKPEDLYRTLTTGIEGTPMPSFATVSQDGRWDLIAYVLSLGEEKRSVARYLFDPAGSRPFYPHEVSRD